VFAGLALTVSQSGALLFVQSFSPPSFTHPLCLSLLLHTFPPCLFLTEFVGIFVLCNVTFHSFLVFLYLFSVLFFCFYALYTLCPFSRSQLSLYLLFKTIFIDFHDSKN